MTIQITRPDVEALINQHLESGPFHDVDELLAEALTALREKEQAADEAPLAAPQKSLREMFEDVRGLTDDIDFSRNPSTGRPVNLG